MFFDTLSKPRFALSYALCVKYSSSPGHETRLLDAESDRSKIFFITSFSRWTNLVKRNMKLHNVRHKRSLSQTMWVFSCIPFIFMTIYMSSSSRIEKLPSSHSSESAEWKVSHEKKERDKRSFSLFGQFHRMEKKKKKERDKRSWLTTTRFQVGEFAKIVLQVLVLLTSRDRTPFFLSWLCLGYLFPLNVSW